MAGNVQDRAIQDLKGRYSPIGKGAGVDDVLGDASLQPRDDLCGGTLPQLDQRVGREESGVGSDQHAWIVVRCLRQVRRFRVLDIQRRPSQLYGDRRW